jgi:hypothetical protein
MRPPKKDSRRNDIANNNYVHARIFENCLDIFHYLVDLSSELGVVAQYSIEERNEPLCLESIDQKNLYFQFTAVLDSVPLYMRQAPEKQF